MPGFTYSSTNIAMVDEWYMRTSKYAPLNDKLWLEQKYVKEWKSSNQIAKSIGVSSVTVLNALRGHNIAIRTEALRSPPVNFFDHIDSEEKAYWLGFIYADGNVGDNGKTFQINLSARDADHLSKLAVILRRPLCLYTFDTPDHAGSFNGVALNKNDHHLWAALFRAGIRPRKTYGEDAKVCDAVPSHLFHHFVRGFFDGDGCISQSTVKGKIMHVCGWAGTKVFLDVLKKRLIEKIGLSDVKLDPKKGVWVLRWSGAEQTIKIREWMYSGATVWLERKKTEFDRIEIKKCRGTSGFRGVVATTTGKWAAWISDAQKRLHLGCFSEKEEAARAYDAAAIRLGKPLYRLNFPLAGV